MGKIYRSITELVGKTPLLELANYEKKHDLSAKLLVKLEYFNPNQSIKDRTALNMIEEAEKKGLIKPGDTLVETTSGNTGMVWQRSQQPKDINSVYTYRIRLVRNVFR